MPLESQRSSSPSRGVAYAFARLNWPGRDLCFIPMPATMMIPGQVTHDPALFDLEDRGVTVAEMKD